MKDKSAILFYILGSFFIANALLAEFIGVKIFSLESTFGLSPLNLTILGIENLSFNLTAGVMLWPVVFIMTDIINEYYGTRGVRFLSYLTIGLIGYAFLIFTGAINLSPSEYFFLFRIVFSLFISFPMRRKLFFYSISYITCCVTVSIFVFSFLLYPKNENFLLFLLPF